MLLVQGVAAGAHGYAEGGIGEEGGEGGDEGGHVLLLAHEAVDAVGDDVGDGAYIGADDGKLVLHGFDERQGKAVVEGGLHEEVGLTEEAFLVGPILRTVVGDAVLEAAVGDGLAERAAGDVLALTAYVVALEGDAALHELLAGIEEDVDALALDEVGEEEHAGDGMVTVGLHRGVGGVGDAVATDDDLVAGDNGGDVVVEVPREEQHGGTTVYQRHEPAVGPAVAVARHALVVLVEEQLTTKQLAQQGEGGVLEEAHAMAGDGDVAEVVAVAHELAEEHEEAGDETPYLLDPALAYLIHRTRRGEVDEVALKRLLDELAVLDVLAHHGGAVHGRREGGDEEDSHIFMRMIFI